MSDAQYDSVMRRLSEVWERIDGVENAIIALNTKVEKFTSTNIAIMSCSCRHEVVLGQEVIVLDKMCGVHGRTAQ